MSRFGPRPRPPEERFLSQLSVVEAGYDTACWKWRNGANLADGYTGFGVGGHNVRLHRWVYEWLVGPIPEGLEPDHLCFNRWCCNPDHLDIVTSVVNNRRAFAHNGGHPNSLKTHCPQGHPYAEYGFIHDGRRNCRICNRRRSRDYQRQKTRERKKEQQ